MNCVVGIYRNKSEGFDCKLCFIGFIIVGIGVIFMVNCSISKFMYKFIMISYFIN